MTLTTAEATQPAMRDTDYLTRHEDLSIPALGPDVACWHAGAGIPPLFIERKGDGLADLASFDDWVKAHRPLIDDLVFKHGAVLFRGFPLATAADYNRIMDNFPRYAPGYVAGMSPRKSVEGQVLESTRLDEKFKIILHSEMAYMKHYTPRISLFCKRAAPVGGETTLGSMDEFMKRMPPALYDKLKTHNTKVVRNFSPAGNTQGSTTIAHADLIGWDEAFFTTDRAEVERQCRELEIDFTWNEDGSLTLKETTPVFTRHPRDRKEYYRTNLHANTVHDQEGFRELAAAIREKQKEPTGHYLDNGEMLTAEEMGTINSLYDQVELAWTWKDGDFAIVDNLKVAHGRNPFQGPREVMVTLLD